MICCLTSTDEQGLDNPGDDRERGQTDVHTSKAVLDNCAQEVIFIDSHKCSLNKLQYPCLVFVSCYVSELRLYSWLFQNKIICLFESCPSMQFLIPNNQLSTHMTTTLSLNLPPGYLGWSPCHCQLDNQRAVC